MVEELIKSIIEELGATGILVIGLYFILYRPLRLMAQHLHKINEELGKIYSLLLTEIAKENLETIKE